MGKYALQLLLCKAQLLSEAPSATAKGFHGQRCIVSAVVQAKGFHGQRCIVSAVVQAKGFHGQ